MKKTMIATASKLESAVFDIFKRYLKINVGGLYYINGAQTLPLPLSA